MAINSNKTYWPHMILGFLVLAIVLGYWTIKAASSMPVQETNDYMMKYQLSDIHINEIQKKQALFDKTYNIKLLNVAMMVMTDNINSNRIQGDSVKLKRGANSFSFIVTNKAGEPVKDANASFLLTRPHTAVDDQMIKTVTSDDNGVYTTPSIQITKPGRYTLQFRAIVGDAIGYTVQDAYLNPEKK